MYDDIVAHALADAPNECCGMIASQRRPGDTGLPGDQHGPQPAEVRDRRAKGAAADLTAIEDAGWDLGAIYHSHTRSPPFPSQTDINLATYPEALYIIVGVHGPEPEVRAFRIVDAKVEEVELSVV